MITALSASDTNPGPRRTISNDGLELTIENVCRDCTGEGRHFTDLMNVQCEASNTHGYAFAEGYLNILSKCGLKYDSSIA